MSLLAAFRQQSSIMPDNIAFIEEDRQLSYLQVLQQVNRIRAQLQSGEKPLQRVAIALEHGMDFAIAILAILNIGDCYIHSIGP